MRMLIKDEVRHEPRANELFLKLLTGRNDPESVLRWMNEAGVFGRFIPDFGQVNAQMQFDMYHHYTVDEHTIRAIGLLAQIERGELSRTIRSRPRSSTSSPARRVLYVATLLHDIAKGRGGDHSVLGAEIALKLCPRLRPGRRPRPRLVAWLVRYHLLMSATAFKRDLADPKTITDFVEQVQSPERLRQLMVLTVVDIRAVGPGIWNSWKRLLRRRSTSSPRSACGSATSATAAPSASNSGSKSSRPRLAGKRQPLVRTRRGCPTATGSPSRCHGTRKRPTGRAAEARIGEATPDVVVEDDAESGATRVSVFRRTTRVCSTASAGLASAGANIIDARIHTTRDGMAVDNFLVLDGRGKPYSRPAPARPFGEISRSGPHKCGTQPPLPSSEPSRLRSSAFEVAPSVAIADRASKRTTVVEVNARDRPALLAALAAAIHAQGHQIHSAHIATYGERAVDVFYVTRSDGRKLDDADIDGLRSALLEAAAEPSKAKAA